MQVANHPFIVKMRYVFMTEDKLYFVMDFIRGGELYQNLIKKKRFNEELARFYTAQIAMGLGALHEKNFIYRDLKPENVLVNEDGFLYLADFGLAKDMAGKDFTETFCGTPEYFAPELIQ
jgi:serine/threonine protein kinase